MTGIKFFGKELFREQTFGASLQVSRKRIPHPRAFVVNGVMTNVAGVNGSRDKPGWYRVTTPLQRYFLRGFLSTANQKSNDRDQIFRQGLFREQTFGASLQVSRKRLHHP